MHVQLRVSLILTHNFFVTLLIYLLFQRLSDFCDSLQNIKISEFIYEEAYNNIDYKL